MEVRLSAPANLPRLLLVWACIGVFRFTGRSLADFAPSSTRLAFMAAQVVIWTLVTYALFVTVDYVPIDRLRWRHVPLLAWVITIATFGRLMAEASAESWIGYRDAVAIFHGYVQRAIDRAYLDTIFLWLIGQGLRAYRIKSELRRLLAEAQFENLKSQLQPHFLFNTLHSLSSLVGSGDPDTAKAVIARLGDLLRHSLTTANRPSVALHQELEILSAYVSIQTLRFDERLRVHIDVAPDVLDAAVPPFLLQPLVENAIRHGVEAMERRCTIAVRAALRGNRLRIEVDDDGRWPEEGIVEGIGLSNTRRRLGLAYGSDCELELRRNASNGTTVIVDLPFETAEEGAPLAAAAEWSR